MLTTDQVHDRMATVQKGRKHPPKRPKKPTPPPPKVKKLPRQRGRTTTAEKEVVARFVHDQQEEVSAQQVTALSHLLRRSPATIKGLIETAREEFVASSIDYVNMHKQAVQGALADGDWEQTIKGSQWAMTNVSAEGVRIVEKTAAVAADSGPRIIIGVKIGGQNTDDAKTVVDVTPE